MPHSQQKHAYISNTHKIRRNLKTKYNDNKKTTISIFCSVKGTLPDDDDGDDEKVLFSDLIISQHDCENVSNRTLNGV